MAVLASRILHPTGFVENDNVWMETPDIIGLQVFDPDYTHGIITVPGGVLAADWSTIFSATDPRTGTSQSGSVIGQDLRSFRFSDRSQSYLDRTVIADPTKYQITGLTVTAAYRKCIPIGQPRFSGESCSAPPAKHIIFLKLSSAPVNGQTYTIHRTDSLFPDLTFTYHDKRTRAGGIKCNQGGYRPNDVTKLACLASRIPAGPNSGVIDFSTYSLGAGQPFYLIDRDGNTVFTGSITARIAWNASTNVDLADLGRPLSITAVSTTGNPTTITFSVNHGLTTNDKVRFFGMSGATGLENGLANAVATVPAANQITIAVSNASALTTTLYNTSLGGVLNTAYPTFATNGYGTNVYGLDFSSFTTPGRYQVYLPEYGVSDEFVIDEAAWAQVASVKHKGIYSLRLGCATPWSSYNRGICLKDGYGGLQNFWSDLVSGASSEGASNTLPVKTGTNPASKYRSGMGAYNPASTRTSDSVIYNGLSNGTRAFNSYPGHQDAGDNDDILADHGPSWQAIIELMKYLPLSSFNFNFGFPTQLSSAICDPTVFGRTTDSMPYLWHELAWYLEAYRTQQGKHPSSLGTGAPPGGFGIGHFTSQNPNYPEPIDYYRGTDPNGSADTAPAGICGAFLYAPDHYGAFIVAALFASFAYVSYTNGLTTVATAYRTAAENAFSWANSIYTNSVTLDAYYASLGVGLKTYMGWDATTYTSAVNTMQANAKSERQQACGMLYQLIAAMDGSSSQLAGGTAQTPYGDIIDSEFSLMANSWGAFAYLKTPGGKAANNNYFKGHGKDGVTNVASLISDTSGFPGTNGCTPDPQTDQIIRAHMIDTFNGVANLGTSDYLKAMQRQIFFITGCNQTGRSHISGFGKRPFVAMLHVDSETAGVSLPDGLTNYGYASSVGQLGTGGFGIGATCDGTLNWVSDNVTGTNEAHFGSKKMYWPWRWGISVLEREIEGRWGNVFESEFTIVLHMLRWLEVAIYLHAWDGNTQTTLTH